MSHKRHIAKVWMDLHNLMSAAFYFNQRTAVETTLLPKDLDDHLWHGLSTHSILSVAPDNIRRQMCARIRGEYWCVFSKFDPEAEVNNAG